MTSSLIKVLVLLVRVAPNDCILRTGQCLDEVPHFVHAILLVYRLPKSTEHDDTTTIAFYAHVSA